MVTPPETCQAGDPPHPPDPDGSLHSPVLYTSPQEVDAAAEGVAGLNIAGQEVDVGIGAGAVGVFVPDENIAAVVAQSEFADGAQE